MAEYLSPGVYVEEYDNSSRAVEGVGTSTAGFIGMAEKGPTKGAPQLVTSFADFQRQYGGYLSEFAYGEYRYLASSVEQFFINGGTRCYIARVIPTDAAAAKADAGILHIEAANEGAWGNRIQVYLTFAASKKMQLMKEVESGVYEAKNTDGFLEGDLVVFGEEYNRILSILGNKVTFEKGFATNPVDTGLVPEKLLHLVQTDMQVHYNEEMEAYTGLSFNRLSPNYIVNRLRKSKLIRLEAEQTQELISPAKAVFEAGTVDAKGVIKLAGGSDGSMSAVNAGTFIGEDKGPGKRTGIQAFIENNKISMLAVPGITMPEVVVSLVAHCENTASRFAVLDMPKELANTQELIEYREIIDSTYAAMYHPWIQSFDRSTQKAGYFPPSGAVMGIYARTDIARGVHKAPANETVLCSDLSIPFTQEEQAVLNPAGVNLIRKFPGQGIRVWGARTASSNSDYKYVNVRRLFIYVEESIKANTNWVVFEPNDAALWTRVEISISGFLDTLWRSGMLAGASQEESYFVEIGPSTMTKDDIRNGRLICNIGIAPSRPAEFVVFRITQFTAQSGGSEE